MRWDLRAELRFPSPASLAGEGQGEGSESCNLALDRRFRERSVRMVPSPSYYYGILERGGADRRCRVGEAALDAGRGCGIDTGLGDRQREVERRAAVGIGDSPQLSAMCFHDGAADRQADAQAV